MKKCFLVDFSLQSIKYTVINTLQWLRQGLPSSRWRTSKWSRRYLLSTPPTSLWNLSVGRWGTLRLLSIDSRINYFIEIVGQSRLCDGLFPARAAWDGSFEWNDYGFKRWKLYGGIHKSHSLFSLMQYREVFLWN